MTHCILRECTIVTSRFKQNNRPGHLEHYLPLDLLQFILCRLQLLEYRRNHIYFHFIECTCTYRKYALLLSHSCLFLTFTTIKCRQKCRTVTILNIRYVPKLKGETLAQLLLSAMHIASRFQNFQ